MLTTFEIEYIDDRGYTHVVYTQDKAKTIKQILSLPGKVVYIKEVK